MRRRKRINIILTVLTLLMAVLLVGMVVNDRQNHLETQKSKMLEKAKWFWDKGKSDKAIWQLNIYLQNNTSAEDSTKAYELLEEYYLETGKTAEADKCRKEIARLNGKTSSDEHETVISAANVVTCMNDDASSGNITIAADYYNTDSMVLCITSPNLMPEIRVNGQIHNRSEELEENADAETSDWFYIDNSEEYVTISGGFNTSIWQFKDEEGTIVDYEIVERTFNDLESHYTGNSIWSTVPIPSEAVKARVTYWSGEKTSVYNNPICINYGSYPIYCVHTQQRIEIPNLSVGETLEYDNSTLKWIKKSAAGSENVDLPNVSINAGYTIAVEGKSIGSITVENVENNDNTECYGVRWSINSTSPIGERVGDAVEKDFGYLIGNDWIGTSDTNDFDLIYPWSDIKRCNILSDGSIVYEGEEGFSVDNNVDVMVEIPNFYVKRTIDEEYEYIWISGSENDGYVIDPAFEQDGEILDKIYIGAFLSGYGPDDILGSYNDTQPVINVSLNAVKDNISEKGNRWAELDFTTLSMLQKLFLVETACKDSQALFMGTVNLSWGSCYSIQSSNTPVNTIVLEDNASSRKINIGDSVTIFDVPQGTSYYSVLTQYENNAGWDRIITRRTKLENGTIQYEFSGEPIVVSEGVTLIMNLPHKTGKTNDLSFATGQVNGSQDGASSFRYRYIENLWGSLCIMLDNISITDGIISIGTSYSSQFSLNYKLAEQIGTTSEGVSPADASILSMGYDINYPLWMLPVKVGNGASSVTAWCDALFYQENGSELILTYGLTWDLRQYAGLFAYRANITENDAKVESGSRLIYK